MRIERAFMRSRVARRIVVLFVACTLVPIVATAILSYGHVRKLLLDQSYQHLAQLGESYASALYDRLWGVSLLLRQVGADVEHAAAANPRGREALRAQLDALVLQRPEGDTPLFGKLTRPFAAPSAPERKTLAKGESVMRTETTPGGATVVTMAHAIDPANLGAGLVVAEIHGAYLWGEADALPAVTHFVVADPGGAMLFSSQGPSRSLLDALVSMQPRTPNGRLAYETPEGPELASFRELFLESHFHVRGWTVAATRPESEVLAPIAAFQHSFVLVTVLALLCIALMSLVQIRRTLVPLERLIDGTRRAADKDFAVQVPVVRNDEFGELAQSFNTMTVRLGRQFTALSTLAEIDRAILTRPDVEQVIDAALRCIRSIVPAERASVVLVDRHAVSSARVFTRGPVEGAATELVRVRTIAVSAGQLALRPEGEWLDPYELPPYAASLAGLGATLFAVPIAWQGEVIGAFIVGVGKAGSLTADEESRVRALADRVGVAFAAATKDEQLYYQAHYDPLTRLPNRLYFRDQLDRAIRRTGRDGGELAVLLVDLDYFKHVNDTVGHAAGDRVLDEAAERMRRCVRASDVVGRLGGDEFTILTADLASAQNASKVAQNVIVAMSRPFLTGGQEHFLSASVGIAVYPADGSTAEELLRNADTAMYRAKEGGRNRCVFFEERMNVAAIHRVRSERELRHAFDAGQFFLVYQPITSLETGRLTGAEALLRWGHPVRGVLTPDHFVQLAEETGLIDPLGEWVLRTACSEMKSLRIDGEPLGRISVNVSPRQFRQPDFAATVRRMVEGAGVGMESIEIEITESLLLDASPAVEAMLRTLSEMGARIALDDFGTGYSSLAYLKRYPVDAVKIDRAFIKDLPFDRSSFAITGAIVSMAHALEKRVVAEGVETAEQASLLREMGCDELQGFHLAKPLRANVLAAFLARRGAVVPIEGLRAAAG
jgi:diguanylate cyclase (GGDEF)-like protein